MPWVRTEDRARCHPKFFRAGFAAFGWWSAGLGYCNEHLTDGFIATRNLELVFPGTLPADRETAIEALVREGLLHVVSRGEHPACRGPLCKRFKAREDGYLMHDFLVYQPSKTHIENVRRVRSTVARKGGVKSGETRKQIASTDAKQTNELSDPIQSNPSQPKPKDSTTPSGSTPDEARPRKGFSADSREVLTWLNDKAGKNFRPTEVNLRFIQARLDDGITAAQLRAIVSRKVREWSGTEQAKFLRPKTLFNATNAEQYVGDLPKLEAVNAG